MANFRARALRLYTTVEEAVRNSPSLLVLPGAADNLCGAMSTGLHPLDFDARQAAKAAERQQIVRELRAGVKTPAQIAYEHRPFAASKPGQVRVRFDLAKRLV